MSRDQRDISQGATRRHELCDVVDFTKTMGVILLMAGLALICFPEIWARDMDPRLSLAGPAVVLVAPGVLYIVAGIFLARRQPWARFAIMIMTSLLFPAACGLLVWNLHRTLRSSTAGLGHTILILLNSLVGFACWLAALAMNLRQLRAIAPELRETQHSVRKGFAVLAPAEPVAVVKADPVMSKEEAKS